MNIARITADWEEDTVTWNTHKGKFDTSNALNKTADCSLDDQYHNYNILSFVNNWRNGIWPNYGIGMYGNEAPSESWIKFFASKEDGSRPHPKLTITYTLPGQPSTNGNNGSTSPDGSEEDNGTETGEKEDESIAKDKSATESAVATQSAKVATPSSAEEKSKGISGLRIALLALLIILLISVAGGYIFYKKRGRFLNKGVKNEKTKEPSENQIPKSSS
jgi:hypothetical protein